MKVYNVIDEAYMVWSFSSVKGVMKFTKPSQYCDRNGKFLDDKDVRKSLREGNDVYLYDFDIDGDLKSDWSMKITVNNLMVIE